MRLPKLKCGHCGYEWVPRVPNPRICPRCKSRLGRVTRRR